MVLIQCRVYTILVLVGRAASWKEERRLAKLGADLRRSLLSRQINTNLGGTWPEGTWNDSAAYAGQEKSCAELTGYGTAAECQSLRRAYFSALADFACLQTSSMRDTPSGMVSLFAIAFPFSAEADLVLVILALFSSFPRLAAYWKIRGVSIYKQ